MSTTIWIWVSDRNAKTTIAALSWQRDAVFSCRVTALPLVSPFTNFSSSACIKVVGLVPSYFYVPCGREYFWNPICTVTFIEGTELSSWIFFFAVSIDSIKGFPVIHTSWIKWHTLLVKYSLPEKQKFSFNDKLFVSRYVRRLLTGHHCPQIGEGERGFFRRRREMKVGKSPQASNVCLLSWTMSPASHNSSGSRKRRGDDRGWESSAGVCGPLHARPPHPQEAPAGSHTCCRLVPVWVPGIGNTGGNRCPPTHCFHKSAKTKTKQDLENGGEGLSWEKMWFMGRKSALMRGRKCRKEKGRRREVWQREPSRHCLYSLVSTIFISIICYSETFRIFTGLKMIHLKRHSTARLQLV